MLCILEIEIYRRHQFHSTVKPKCLNEKCRWPESMKEVFHFVALSAVFFFFWPQWSWADKVRPAVLHEMCVKHSVCSNLCLWFRTVKIVDTIVRNEKLWTLQQLLNLIPGGFLFPCAKKELTKDKRWRKNEKQSVHIAGLRWPTHLGNTCNMRSHLSNCHPEKIWEDMQQNNPAHEKTPGKCASFTHDRVRSHDASEYVVKNLKPCNQKVNKHTAAKINSNHRHFS